MAKEKIMIDKDNLQNLKETVENAKINNEKRISSMISECYLDDDILPLLERLKSDYNKSMLDIIDQIEEIIKEY